MLILVEGCDKTGKSTMIRHLEDELDAPVFKNLLKPSDSKVGEARVHAVYKTAYQLALQLFSSSTKHIIFDRSHITEFVYASVLRSYDPIKTYCKLTDMILGNAIVIYMTARPEVIIERFIADHEDFLTPDKIEAILSKYGEVFSVEHLPMITISSEIHWKLNHQQVMSFIHEQQKLYEHRRNEELESRTRSNETSANDVRKTS